MYETNFKHLGQSFCSSTHVQFINQKGNKTCSRSITYGDGSWCIRLSAVAIASDLQQVEYYYGWGISEEGSSNKHEADIHKPGNQTADDEHMWP